MVSRGGRSGGISGGDGRSSPDSSMELRYELRTVTRIYEDLAGWYPLLTHPSDYEEEAKWYADLLRHHALREVVEVLELGCGIGANASHMKAWFQMFLSDRSPAMLKECAHFNPELPRYEGDLRSLRLDRRFDAVFVHDAASYLLTEEDLSALAETVEVHLRPGGVALICPDDLQENFRPETSSGGHDGTDGRSLRYVEWSRPGDAPNEVLTDFALLLKDADGTVSVAHDRHRTGRLPGHEWRRALASVGLEVEQRALEHSEVESGRQHLFVAVRPMC